MLEVSPFVSPLIGVGTPSLTLWVVPSESDVLLLLDEGTIGYTNQDELNHFCDPGESFMGGNAATHIEPGKGTPKLTFWCNKHFEAHTCEPTSRVC